MKGTIHAFRFAVSALVCVAGALSRPWPAFAGEEPPGPQPAEGRTATDSSSSSKSLPGGGVAIARNILRAVWDPDGASHMDAIARTELSSTVKWYFTIEARVARFSRDGSSLGGTIWRTKVNVTGGASAERVKVSVGDPNGHLWRNETAHKVTGNGVNWNPTITNTWDCRPTCN